MLIDETNWKQELAKLKARRIVLMGETVELAEMWQDGVQTQEIIDRAAEVYSEIDDVLDKAIETIENVFVHKRCYI